MPDASISVIIPARDAPLLPHTLTSLATPGNLCLLREVIVISAQAGPTQEVDLPLQYLTTGRPVTSPVARNLGIQAGSGSWFAFIDADCIASPDWLSRLLAAASAPNLVVGGGVTFGRSSYWADVHNVSMLHDYHVSAPAGPRPFLPSLNLLVHRSVIEAVGLMNEKLRRAHDVEWTGRMRYQGYQPWFEPRAAVEHRPDRDLRSIWRDYLETGTISPAVRTRFGLPPAFPGWLSSSLLLYALAPAVAVAATLRVFLHRPALARYWPAAPGIWLTKLAWCLGAARAAGQGG